MSAPPFVPPTRLQKLCAYPPLWFWTFVSWFIPVSWWFDRKQNLKRGDIYIYVAAEMWWYEERRSGRC